MPKSNDIGPATELSNATLDHVVGGDKKAPPKPAPKPQPKISFDGVAGESSDDKHKDWID